MKTHRGTKKLQKVRREGWETKKWFGDREKEKLDGDRNTEMILRRQTEWRDREMMWSLKSDRNREIVWRLRREM